MRDIPSAFSGGAMTLAHCWRLTRRDGVIFGFTDHDCDLQFDNCVYRAKTGLSASDMTEATGFEVTGGDLAGALTSAGITENDIAAGCFDGATLDLHMVDWTNCETRFLIERGVIGEIRRNGGQFICEMRGLSSLYQEEKGRLYQPSCSADLGDGRCGINLDQPLYTYHGEILETDGARYFEIDADPAQFRFEGGGVTFTSGSNLGQKIEIKTQMVVQGRIGLVLWTLASQPLAIGDGISVTVGCDKSFETCCTKFSNSKNFRGFPHIPGPDFILEIAKNGDMVMDGGSLFK